MGFGMPYVEYLAWRGYIKKPKTRILDIGSQNLYHATPEAIRRFVEEYGHIDDEQAFHEEAKRLSYFSWPRPGERTSYLSELFDLTPLIEYTSYDVCPALKTEIFDLNVESLPEPYREYFDIVLNFGTTEHIIHQLNCLKVMHEAVAVGGIAFHQVPTIGWLNHGYFCYHMTLFNDLAKVNDYELVDCWYNLAGQHELAGEDVDIRNAENPHEPRNAQIQPCQTRIPSYNLNVVMRKRSSRPFAVTLELATSHSALSETVSLRYGNTRPDLTAVPGRALAKELAHRVKRRVVRALGLA